MKRVTLVLAILTVSVIVFGYLIYNGFIWLNVPDYNRFPVRGIDVSSHQKVIDWSVLKEKGKYDFVFIKATEGSNFKDSLFTNNWGQSKKAGFIRGAYHFFTFKSSGLDQAKNFIETVPIEKGCLPPVIDIEFSGNSKIVPQKNVLVEEIEDFINEITKHYGKSPVLYVTYESYERYIKGNFNDCKIWIRDMIKHPGLSDEREWIFWQYCNRGRVPGISTFVDLNVFKGDIRKFNELLDEKTK